MYSAGSALTVIVPITGWAWVSLIGHAGAVLASRQKRVDAWRSTGRRPYCSHHNVSGARLRRLSDL
jgi:hypothetical protein